MQNQNGNKKVVISLVIVVCVVALCLYAVTHKKESGIADNNNLENTTINQNTITTNPTDAKSDTTKKPMDTNKRLLANFTPVAHTATLEKKDIVVGTGAEVKAGDTVSVHYTGAVAATGEIFQSSKDFGTTPITFPLSGVIKGWTDGIPGMKIGGTRRLIIPAAQAYGATPPPGSGIPANADLVFDVELVAIQ